VLSLTTWTSDPVTVTVSNPPTIASFTPSSGPVGTSVTISGTNFTSATSVQFNGVSAGFTASSATTITATVPAGATLGVVGAIIFSVRHLRNLLKRVLKDAQEIGGITRVGFTGGEPTLHPQFIEVIETVATAGLTSSFVTNGWHFERIWPAVLANRESITHVAFSLDGITRETHDSWRGEGSFDRLVRAEKMLAPED